MVHFTKILLLLQKSVAFRDIAYNMHVQGEGFFKQNPHYTWIPARPHLRPCIYDSKQNSVMWAWISVTLFSHYIFLKRKVHGSLKENGMLSCDES